MILNIILKIVGMQNHRVAVFVKIVSTSLFACVNRVNDCVTPAVFVVPREKGVTFRFHLIIVAENLEKKKPVLFSSRLKDPSRQEQRVHGETDQAELISSTEKKGKTIDFL